jgi:ribosomal protein S27AE
MSRPEEILRLACPECYWTPDPNETMATVEEHWRTERPEQEGLRLLLEAFCPRCGLHMTDPAIRHIDFDQDRLTYDCSKCHRTYEIRQRRTR